MSSEEPKSLISGQHELPAPEHEHAATENNDSPFDADVALSEDEKMKDRRLRWKMDFLIMPLLIGLYFLASLDRSDIANAAVAGMNKALGLTPQQFSTCIALFSVGYIVFQLPGELSVRPLGPHIQLSGALVVWGLATALCAVAKDYAGLAVLRTVVGIGEAFLQASVLYLTFWYKRDELATRGSIFFSISGVAGACSGLIAYAITKNINMARGILAWQWIFIIEGVVTIAYSAVIFFLLPPLPEKLRRGWSEEEKALAVKRTQQAFNDVHGKIKPRELLELARDPQAYLYIVIYCCLNISLTCFASFLPLILTGIGFDGLRAQIYTVPPYAALTVASLIVGFVSDCFKNRGFLLIICFFIASAGWLILLVSQSTDLSFGATFLIGIGTFPTVILCQAYSVSNIIGFTKKAGILALQGIFGQVFSIIGSEVFSDPPKYTRGKAFSLGAMIIGMLVTMGLMLYLHLQNKKKREGQNTEEAARLRARHWEEASNKHPDFLFYL